MDRPWAAVASASISFCAAVATCWPSVCQAETSPPACAAQSVPSVVWRRKGDKPHLLRSHPTRVMMGLIPFYSPLLPPRLGIPTSLPATAAPCGSCVNNGACPLFFSFFSEMGLRPFLLLKLAWPGSCQVQVSLDVEVV